MKDPNSVGQDNDAAPGQPGLPPRWTSSAKQGVGAAVSGAGRLWFTLSNGIVTEVFSPRVDQACTRDMELLVTDSHGFFSEEKRDTATELRQLEPGIPAYELTNTCREGRYRIQKTVLTDPRRDALLQHIRFDSLTGSPWDYRLFALLAPHLRNRGMGNSAWVGDHKGVSMLFAAVDGLALAFACSTGWRDASVGYVGFSDGWQEVSRHHSLTDHYRSAPDGNVAVTGEIDPRSGEFTLALAFGNTPSEAGYRAAASLADGFPLAKRGYVDGWQAWWAQRTLEPKRMALFDDHTARTSLMVIKTHEAQSFPGGIIASLSIPWGETKGDDDLGGYHLVWPRDLVEAAGGLLAGGAYDEARRVLTYLAATQEPDGHWPQNMWLDGTPYWSGIQMDETALPILLVDLAARQGALTQEETVSMWPMVRRAASYIVQFGPVSDQDRWEEDPGYTPFTIAAEVAALVTAAELADRQGESGLGNYLRETADTWNYSVERWMYVTGTDLATECGVDGYYVRVAPPETADAGSPTDGFVPIKNRPPNQSFEAATEIVSVDALALVRFGLRSPDDRRILNTIRVIDHLLRVDLPQGPLFRRYNEDGYGEHSDGSPFDGTGIGRPWPLLTAERAHYELAAGRLELAQELAETVSASANDGGMIPEQTWDGTDLPDLELHTGRPSGSAMPLVWAHAEYLKLKRSLLDGRVFDMPPQPIERYQENDIGPVNTIWRFNHKCRTMPEGAVLRIEVQASASVRWWTDSSEKNEDVRTIDSGLGVHYVDLDTNCLTSPSSISFTFRWLDASRWEGTDFSIVVVPAEDRIGGLPEPRKVED